MAATAVVNVENEIQSATPDPPTRDVNDVTVTAKADGPRDNTEVSQKGGQENVISETTVQSTTSVMVKVSPQLITSITQKLSKLRQMGNRDGQRLGHRLLGKAYYDIGDMKQAIEHYELFLSFNKEVEDKAAEGQAYTCLGVAYHMIGDFNRAIEYHGKHLNIAKEVEDRRKESRAYGNLGNAYHNLGDFKKALEYHRQDLSISKEVKDKAAEGQAYCNLGNAYRRLADFRQAMECHKQHLSIAIEIGDRAREGRAYSNLGNDSSSLGNYKQAIEYHKQSLGTAKDFGDKAQEGRVYGNLGIAYQYLGDLKTAIEYYKKQLAIAISVKDKTIEGSAYGNLGNGYKSLGDFNQAIEYHKKGLAIAKELFDRAGEGQANGNLSNAYRRLGDYRQAILYGEKDMEIAKEVGNKAGEGSAYGNLGISYNCLGDCDKAIEYHKLHLRFAIEVGDMDGAGRAHVNLGTEYQQRGDFKQSIECYKQALDIFKELEDAIAEGNSNYNLGSCFAALGLLNESLCCYQNSIEQFNRVRNQLQSKDDWKITLRNQYQQVYGALWSILLRQGKCVEALCAAEQGRAQALVDLMMSQYGLEPASSGGHLISVSDINDILQSTILFLAVRKTHINMWILQKGKSVLFRKTRTDDDAAAYLQSVLENFREELVRKDDSRCEDRSLDSPGDAEVTTMERKEGDEESLSEDGLQKTTGTEHASSSPLPVSDDPLTILYDLIIAPVADLLSGDELIIVPDGSLFLTPFAAFQSGSQYLSESFRIRVLPSLTSLKLIADSPPDYHSRNGALIVGDPWVQEIVRKGPRRTVIRLLKQLPAARKEVEMIGNILHISPLIGEEATKAEVIKRLNSVALIHIAAHGKMETGEIALAPNPTRASPIPVEEDYYLTMEDVLSVRLRAQLVVLSCCHSGRGNIKAEGVVGIARAFLGAGARCVLVSLWAIEDEATLEFMRHFYQLLVDGKSASESLNQTMKSLRESERFSKVKCWAPFVLIGDDVTLDLSDPDSNGT